MICSKKVHQQFVSFASSFQTKIYNLKTNFFNEIRDPSNKYHLHFPLLLVTATMNLQHVHEFKKISGFNINPAHYVWVNVTGISQRHINSYFQPSHVVSKLYSIIKDFLEKNCIKNNHLHKHS